MNTGLNVVENAIDYRMGMIIKGMNNILKLNSNRLEYTRVIPLSVMIQEVTDDLVLFVSKEEASFHIVDLDVRKRIMYLVENVLNNVKVHFTDTEMELTIYEVA